MGFSLWFVLIEKTMRQIKRGCVVLNISTDMIQSKRRNLVRDVLSDSFSFVNHSSLSRIIGLIFLSHSFRLHPLTHVSSVPVNPLAAGVPVGIRRGTFISAPGMKWEELTLLYSPNNCFLETGNTDSSVYLASINQMQAGDRYPLDARSFLKCVFPSVA